MRQPTRGTLAVAAVAGVLSTAGCVAGPASPWNEPADYTYDASISVFGPAHGEWRVTVRDHAVVAVEGLDEWSVIGDSANLEHFSPLAEYLERYDEARDQGAHMVELRQATDGTPLRYAVDWSADTLDDEYTATFSDIKVLEE